MVHCDEMLGRSNCCWAWGSAWLSLFFFYFIFISFLFLFKFFIPTHTNTSHPHHKHVAMCAQSSVCREELFCWVEFLTSMSNFSMQQLPEAHWVIVAFQQQALPGLITLILCHPLGLFLLPNSNQALFYCILCQCVNDFVRIPQPCPAGRVGEDQSWRVTSSARILPWGAWGWLLEGAAVLSLLLMHSPLCPSLEEYGILLEDLHTSLLQGACDRGGGSG